MIFSSGVHLYSVIIFTVFCTSFYEKLFLNIGLSMRTILFASIYNLSLNLSDNCSTINYSSYLSSDDSFQIYSRYSLI